MLISGVEFSKLSNTSKQNICKLARNKKLVKTIDDKYDTEDKINQDYLLSRGLTLDKISDFLLSMSSSSNKNKQKEEPKSIQIPVIKKSENIEISTHKSKKQEQKFEELDDISGDAFESMTGLPAKMMNLTMRKLVMKYGGPMQLKSWADLLNKFMQASERDQKIQEKRLELIEKDFVTSRLFLYIETLSKLLFDFPDSCVDRIIAIIESKKENQRVEIISDMRKELGVLIKQSKDSIIREIDGLMTKYEKEKENENKDLQ